MKSQFNKVVLIAGLTLFGSLSLNAQENKAVATVPFAFQANHTSYAAGTYEVTRLANDGRFQVMEKSTGHSIFVPAPLMKESAKADSGHLTFACSGDDCILAEIWLPNSTLGYVRSRSAIENDRQRKLGVATMISVRLSK